MAGRGFLSTLIAHPAANKISVQRYRPRKTGRTRIHDECAPTHHQGHEGMSVQPAQTATAPTVPSDRQRMEDVGFLTCMTLVWLGNYAQTGHFGGPLAYTPFNVATHLAGQATGGPRH